MSGLIFSEQESQSLGLKIGRAGRHNKADFHALWEQIQAGGFDWVKFKQELSDREVFRQLESLPCFSEPFNIIALQKAVPVFAPLPPACELSFECYDGNQKVELREVLLDILREDTNLYYQSDIYNAIMPADRQTKTSVTYYLSMNQTENANKFLFIGRNREGEAVGVCSFMRTADTIAEGVIYGVRPKFRSQQFAGIFLQHSINTLAELGVESFFTEVQYYNFRSLYPHLKSGFRPAGLYANLNLYPFLSTALDNFTCSASQIQEAINERVHTLLGVKVDSRWAGIRGDVALLTENALNVRILICDPQISLVSLQSGNRICYLKIDHQNEI